MLSGLPGLAFVRAHLLKARYAIFSVSPARVFPLAFPYTRTISFFASNSTRGDALKAITRAQSNALSGSTLNGPLRKGIP